MDGPSSGDHVAAVYYFECLKGKKTKMMVVAPLVG